MVDMRKKRRVLEVSLRSCLNQDLRNILGVTSVRNRIIIEMSISLRRVRILKNKSVVLLLIQPSL